MCKTDVERDISWRDGTILLRDTPLDEVLWTLSKCFNVEFEVRGDHYDPVLLLGYLRI